MVLWQSDLRVSWRSQWLSLLIHGVLAGAILLAPWPMTWTLIWLLLLSLVVFDCVRSQRRIHARQGEIKLLQQKRIKWQGREWQMVGNPWMLQSGILLRLKRADRRRYQHLWLAADSMGKREWRELRQLLIRDS
ncbi:protein YgfX [Entomohabitans teleogrylli]|uniref:protein YgfX n=1 Tax=Entomohabitans teleogrylli TaxID=1384589 RepID=UPI00073D795E|nr:protein YgfX [Entomohabitans teleogrylli]